VFERIARRVRCADWVPQRHVSLKVIGPLRSSVGVPNNEDNATLVVPVWRLHDIDRLTGV